MIAGELIQHLFYVLHLAIMRKAKSILIGYITSAIITAVISNKFVEMKGLEELLLVFSYSYIFIFVLYD